MCSVSVGSGTRSKSGDARVYQNALDLPVDEATQKRLQGCVFLRGRKYTHHGTVTKHLMRTLAYLT